MKQFIIDRHTDPQNPEAIEIPTEKIPVYETEADLDTDLADLEDGQIVAIQDEGASLSVPIDEVKSGDMHAVTSNAVAEAYGEVQVGTVQITCAANDVFAYNLTFPKPFKTIPKVFVTINDTINDTINAQELISNSVALITTTGCQIRGYNYYSTQLSPNISWLAIAK